MSETEVVRRLLEETDCALLLNVANHYIDSVNLGFDWREWFQEIPFDRAVQLHFVDAHKDADRLIDARADATGDEAWNVFREASVMCDIKGAILERDGNCPNNDELICELRVARELFRIPSEADVSSTALRHQI